MNTSQTIIAINLSYIGFGIIMFLGILSDTGLGMMFCFGSFLILLVLEVWKNQLKTRLAREDNMKYNEAVWRHKVNQARTYEHQLDYEHALSLYRELNMIDDVRRINKLKYNTLSGNPSNTTIIHGDYVDDRDTLVKDSVLNRSNVGSSGKSKVEELEKVSGLKEKGLINNEEYEQMKKEILGK